MKTIINKLFKTLTFISEDIKFLGKYYVSINDCNTNTCIEIAEDKLVDVICIEGNMNNDFFAKIIATRLFQIEGVTGILLSDNSIEVEIDIYKHKISSIKGRKETIDSPLISTILEDCKMTIGSTLDLLRPQKKEIDSLIDWASELIKKK